VIGDSAASSFAAVGFDAALLLGALGYLLGGGEPGDPLFVTCHCDRPECSGVRRVRGYRPERDGLER
jgi:hypothetical protein